MRASSRSSHSIGLQIEGRLAEEPESGQTSGGLSSPIVVVAGVLSVGYLPPPGKGKGRLARLGILMAPNF